MLSQCTVNTLQMRIQLLVPKLSNLKSSCSIELKFSGKMLGNVQNLHVNFPWKIPSAKKVLFYSATEYSGNHLTLLEPPGFGNFRQK